ncbi:MAG TPA: DUF2332 domain-containing protein [Nocardioides sp.]|nr:DUF2332 domain-containing protein [Nocardioides sp.]
MARSQATLLRDQGRACERLGSPMYAELLARLADDLEAGGPTARVLRGHEDDPGPSGLALRLAGSVHRLVLAGAAPELTAYYPTTGGRWTSDGVAAVLDLLDRRADEVRPLLDQAPQTNEVGRAAALLGGLLRAVDRRPLPVRLFEIGASGGLNLLVDRFHVTDDAGGAWGDPASPVLLAGAWEGATLPLGREVEIVERGGCDVSPVDVATEDGRLTLTSYVWPDMAARHARLAGAITLARREPVRVERADAASYVDGLGLVAGCLTVVWHSVMWQYVPAEQQARVTGRLAALGAEATEDAPLVHLFAEPTRRDPQDRHRFWVVAETWPGGGEREYLGLMAPHGIPVVWD